MNNPADAVDTTMIETTNTADQTDFIYSQDEIDNALKMVQSEAEVLVPTALFTALLDYTNDHGDGLSEEQFNSVMSVCATNHPRYMPELITPTHYDVQYLTPMGVVGTHAAMLANDVVDAVIRTPIMLSFGTPWHPSEFKVLSIMPTPIENRPKPTVTDTTDTTA